MKVPKKTLYKITLGLMVIGAIAIIFIGAYLLLYPLYFHSYHFTFFHKLFFLFIGALLLLSFRRKNDKQWIACLIAGGVFLLLGLWGSLVIGQKESVYILHKLFSLAPHNTDLHFILGLFFGLVGGAQRGLIFWQRPKIVTFPDLSLGA